jgi:hypothetical protein
MSRVTGVGIQARRLLGIWIDEYNVPGVGCICMIMTLPLP